MGVYVHGHADVRVSHDLLDCLYVHTGLHHCGGTAMAQVVQANVGQILSLHEAIPLLSHGIGFVGVAVRLADNEALVMEARFSLVPVVFFLALLVIEFR